MRIQTMSKPNWHCQFLKSHWNNTESPIGKSTSWLFPGMGETHNGAQPFTPCLIGAWPGMITQQEKNSIHVLITKKPFFWGYHHFWKRHPARPLTISRVYQLRLRWGNEFWREKNDRKTMSSTYHAWDVNFLDCVKECDVRNIFLHIRISSR